MLNPLKIATDGYLKQTKKAALVIAVAGYLSFGVTPEPPIISDGGGYRGASMKDYEYSLDYKARQKKKQLLEEDNIIMACIEAFVKII